MPSLSDYLSEFDDLSKGLTEEPWDQREGEGSDEYDAFLTYLEADSPRTVRKAWIRWERNTEYSYDWFLQTGRTWEWYDRAIQFDTQGATHVRQRWFRRRESMLEKLYQVGEDMAAEAIRALKEGPRIEFAKGPDGEETDKRVVITVSPGDVVRLAGGAKDIAKFLIDELALSDDIVPRPEGSSSNRPQVLLLKQAEDAEHAAVDAEYEEDNDPPSDGNT